MSAQEKVIRATANTKRGKIAGPEQQADILRLVLDLEAASPTRDPATSDLINGRWSLLYTGAVPIVYSPCCIVLLDGAAT